MKVRTRNIDKEAFENQKWFTQGLLSPKKNFTNTLVNSESIFDDPKSPKAPFKVQVKSRQTIEPNTNPNKGLALSVYQKHLL